MKQQFPKVFIDFLGCKLNQAEAESLSYQFSLEGCPIVKSCQQADICVLNTCTVTHIADRKSRQWLRRTRRLNPQALLVATGCYVQRCASDLQEIDPDAIILDNEKKQQLVEIVKSRGWLELSPGDAQSITGLGRTRSLVKIQEGCASSCSYCIVPLVRPGSKSRPAGEILKEVKSRLSDGYREIVLTGTEIGSYRCLTGNLERLIKMVLDIKELERLRLSSLQPGCVSRQLLELWQDERLCGHIHLPLQSGSQDILEIMNRRYSLWEYLDTLQMIRDYIPDAAITTDVITGFPGETQNDFERTVSVCREAEFARIHVFPFSKRPETAACRMPDQVDYREIKKRESALLALAAEATNSFMARYTGKNMRVLWEERSGQTWSGLTHNYIRVYCRSDRDLGNTFSEVRLVGRYRDGMLAKDS